MILTLMHLSLFSIFNFDSILSGDCFSICLSIGEASSSRGHLVLWPASMNFEMCPIFPGKYKGFNNVILYAGQSFDLRMR